MPSEQIAVAPTVGRSGRRALLAILRGALDALVPALCVSCRSPLSDPRALCSSCWRQLTFITAPYCEIMGTPLAFDAGPGARSPELRWNHPLYDRARAAVMFDTLSRRIVHQLKYHDVPGVARLMAGLMAANAREICKDADCLIPVPLHKARLVARRFNQAVQIADHLSPQVGVPVLRFAVQRVRHTPHQVGLSRDERADNLHNAFKVIDRQAIAGGRVVLVDDVLTSGATCDALAWTLKAAGARSVNVAVFARAAYGAQEPA